MSTTPKDLKDLKINLSFNEIALLSKRKFKMIVRNACIEMCFNELLNDKSKLSKGSEIVYTKFSTQNYLKPGHGLSIEKMRRIYHARCRETFLKCNFPSNFSDKKCVSLCDSGSDSEKHIYTCNSFSAQNEIISEITPFECIFTNNVIQQIKVIDILYARLEIRKKFTLSPPPMRAPLDPRRANTAPRLGIREAKHKRTLNKNKRRKKK